MKNLINTKSLLRFAVVTAILFSCSTTSTMLTGTWKAPTKVTESYHNILIAALVENIQAKSTIETNLATELAKNGVQVSKSLEVFPPNFSDEMNEKDRILNEIDGDGFDAILTISLLDQKTQSRYIPGTYSYAPYPRFEYYGNFWGYFTHWYPLTYTPGYYVYDKTYYIETNLYDVKTRELMWSAQSETYNPSSLSNFSQDFTQAITKELKQEDLI